MSPQDCTMSSKRFHSRPWASSGAAVLFGLLLLSAPACWAKSGNKNDTDQRSAARADRLYEEHQFGSAYKTYLQLAKKGDPFSQYRASYMNLEGEGVQKDLVQAYGWAVLAAESRIPDLVKYQAEVAAAVPSDQLAAAHETALAYSRECGKVALAIAATDKAKRTLRDCTGSRIGTRCEEVYAVQMPKFWSISPGAGDGSDGGSAAPSGSISVPGGGAGGETRDGQYYAELREYTAVLEQYICIPQTL